MAPASTWRSVPAAGDARPFPPLTPDNIGPRPVAPPPPCPNLPAPQTNPIRPRYRPVESNATVISLPQVFRVNIPLGKAQFPCPLRRVGPPQPRPPRSARRRAVGWPPAPAGAPKNLRGRRAPRPTTLRRRFPHHRPFPAREGKHPSAHPARPRDQQPEVASPARRQSHRPGEQHHLSGEGDARRQDGREPVRRPLDAAPRTRHRSRRGGCGGSDGGDAGCGWAWGAVAAAAKPVQRRGTSVNGINSLLANTVERGGCPHRQNHMMNSLSPIAIDDAATLERRHGAAQGVPGRAGADRRRQDHRGRSRDMSERGARLLVAPPGVLRGSSGLGPPSARGPMFSARVTGTTRRSVRRRLQCAVTDLVARQAGRPWRAAGRDLLSRFSARCRAGFARKSSAGVGRDPFLTPLPCSLPPIT